MAVPETNETWQELIDEVASKIQPHEIEPKYSFPDKQTAAFRGLIDHTLLKLDATAGQIDQLCVEAWEWEFASVCVRPNWVKRCVENLAKFSSSATTSSTSSEILVASVIGFHEGDYPLDHKLKEIDQATSTGAGELDIVLNYHPLLAKDYKAVHAELHALRAAAPNLTLKLILETSRLTSSQIVQASVIAGRNGFDFIKTSTGFHGEGAKVKDVGIMRACAEVLAQLDAGNAKKMRVKASGGIRDLSQAEAMLEAGAVRLGCSAGVQIAHEAGGQKRALSAELKSSGPAAEGSSGGGDY